MDLDEKYRTLQQKQKQTEELAKNELIKNQEFQRQFHVEKEKIRQEFERKNKENIRVLLSEKEREIINLKRACTNFSNQLSELEARSAQKLNESEFKFQQLLVNSTKDNSTLKKELLSYIDNEKKTLGEKEQRMKNMYEEKLAKKDKEKEEELRELADTYEKKINLITCQFTNLQNKSEEEQKKKEKETDRVKSGYLILVEKTKQKLREKFDSQIKKMKAQADHKIYEIKTHSNSILEQSSRKLGELTDLYEKTKTRTN